MTYPASPSCTRSFTEPCLVCTGISSLPRDSDNAMWKSCKSLALGWCWLAPAFVCAQTLFGGCWIALVRSCSELISFLLQYIFTDAYAQYLWITFDFCNTIQGFSIPFRAADLLLHSKASNLLLGFDRSHPNKQVRELLEHRWSSSCFLLCPLLVWIACLLSDLPLAPPSSSLRLNFCSYYFTFHG